MPANMRLLLLLPFILAFASLCALSLHFHVFAMDEYTYMNAADSFARNDPSLVLEGERGRFYAFPLLLSPLLRAYDDVETVTKLANLAIFFASVAALYVLARRLAGNEAAYWAALLAATNPLLGFLSTRVLTEPLFVLLLMLCGLALHSFAKRPSWGAAIAGGALAAALVGTRFVGLYIFVITAAYLWAEKKLALAKSKYAAGALAAFLATGTAIILIAGNGLAGSGGSIIGFVVNQINVRQGDLSLPDKIPSYILALPFTLAFAVPWLFDYARSAFGRLRDGKHSLPVIAALGIAVCMEAYGAFNFRLLRYIAPAVPFLCILAGAAIAQRPGARKWAYVAVALNFIVLAGSVLGAYTMYEKHTAYAEAGRFAAKACKSTVYTNMPAVLVHFTTRAADYGPGGYSGQDCVVVSAYEPWPYGDSVPGPGYSQAYFKQGIKVLKRE